MHLDGAGANYHLNVTPIGNLDGQRAFDSTTSGANCIGTPCGDNDNAFLDSSLFGAVFEPVADFGSQFSDFSMGVNGTVSGGGGGITLASRGLEETSRERRQLRYSSLPGVECRQGDLGTATNDRVYVLGDGRFRGSTSTSCGRVMSTTFSGNTVTVLLNNIQTGCDGSDVTVTLTGVNGGSGTLASAAVTFGQLAR